MPELRAICKITGVNPFQGGSWIGLLSPDNAEQILHALLVRDDPALTIEQVREMVGVEDIRSITDVCCRLVIGKTIDEIEQAAGEALDENPLPPKPTSEPSAGSISA